MVTFQQFDWSLSSKFRRNLIAIYSQDNSVPKLSKQSFRARRTREGLTQDQLAIRASVSKRTVENAENGETVSESTHAKLAFALRTHPSHLLEEAALHVESQEGPRLGSSPPVPLSLVGRDQDMEKIRSVVVSQLAESQMQTELALVVVTGVPGVGKTTMAKALAHDDAMKSTFRGTLWTSLGALPEIRSVLESWAVSLGLSVSSTQSDQQIADRITGYLAGESFLLIIDDAFTAKAASKLLLGGIKCATVITTRFPIVQEELSNNDGAHYSLTVLSEEASLELLERLAPDVVKKYESQCRRFVREVECLPLALNVAGRMLKKELKRFGNVEGLLERLLTDADELLEQNVPADVYALVGEVAPTVRALLQLSTDLLDEETRQRFIGLSAFEAKPAVFHAKHVAMFWGNADPQPTLNKLVDLGLVEPLGDLRFSIHALIVNHARSLR